MIELLLLAHAVLICIGVAFWFAFRGEPSRGAAHEKQRDARPGHRTSTT